MANIGVSLISLVLFFSIAAHGRKTLYTTKEISASSLIINDGICKTMVEIQGYTCEEHKVTTEDGYILSLQRMPTRLSGKKADKPPVLIQHGIFFDGIVWLLNSPEESLGFILADSGFDVWLVNNRGTKYSTMHTSLSSNDKAYWDWSWDELASYDLPASVQYVYNHTGQKIYYVGHSQGSLLVLVALSQGKLLNMLRSAALLSPIAYMNFIPSVEIRLAADNFLADVVYRFGIYKFIPNMNVAIKFVKDICNTLNIKFTSLLALLSGPNCCMNSSRLDFYLDYEPQPTSTKNLIHFSQMIKTGQIAKYDYVDQAQNLLHYGQVAPPTYDMTKIPSEFPLFLGVGGKDILANIQNVKLLLNDLNNHDPNKLKVLCKDDYAHLDFGVAVNAKQVIYDPMIAFFNAY
ncbi:hypothetical protein P8452_26445 [Trifolium repens]|nr:hypothetical protein P8452_26445 [Trifolium repens]